MDTFSGIPVEIDPTMEPGEYRIIDYTKLAEYCRNINVDLHITRKGPVLHCHADVQEQLANLPLWIGKEQP